MISIENLLFVLDRNYEVYFQSNNPSKPNLLTIDHLRSLCRKQKQLINLLQLQSTCHFSLPEMIAYFVNKSDCEQLVDKDIPIFIERIQRCHALYDTGLIRLAGLKRYRMKPLELFQYDICFRHNFTFLTLEYLLDKTFLQTNETFYTGMWFIKPKNPMKTINNTDLHTADTAYDLFVEHFNENPKFDDEWTRIAALNFLDIRIPAAMKQIRVDMSFVILAISLIIAVSILYSILLRHFPIDSSGNNYLSSINYSRPNDQYLRCSFICLRVFRLQNRFFYRSISLH